MADRALWSGNIGFGLVSIPVKLFTATRPKDISFHLVHLPCGTRIEQKRWCPTHEDEVPWSEVGRGYEYTKGRYVVLTDEDFAELPVRSRHTIDIAAFVGADEIEPIYYEKTYYLLPGKHGEKPFALLHHALSDEDLVAIATITIRRKEQLCAVHPRNGILLLETLYYSDELLIEGAENPGKTRVAPEDLKLARQLVKMLRRPFEATEYTDSYREALEQMIEAKRKGKETVAAPKERHPDIIDLREALSRSLTRSRARRNGKRSAPARRRTRKTAAQRAG